MYKLIDNFAKYCLLYPKIEVESLFNNYMQTLSKDDIMQLKPYFMLLVKTGESARKANSQIKKYILEEKEF